MGEKEDLIERIAEIWVAANKQIDPLDQNAAKDVLKDLSLESLRNIMKGIDTMWLTKQLNTQKGEN